MKTTKDEGSMSPPPSYLKYSEQINPRARENTRRKKYHGKSDEIRNIYAPVDFLFSYLTLSCPQVHTRFPKNTPEF